MTNEWEVKNVLVTVKAYPNPSRRYGETVCIAGIDLRTNKWVRLYPIPFRDLDNEQKFKKYSIIEVKAKKSIDDNRLESFKVDVDSIKIKDFLNTKDKWERRKRIVLSNVDKSMCEILQKRETEEKSLGAFKPRKIDFVWKKSRSKNQNERESCYAQLSFFNKIKGAPEVIPYDFRYRFFCNNKPLCRGHDYSIIDWEIGQAYRDWRLKYSSESLLLEKIKQRWLTLNCSTKNDVYFFVGNLKRFRDKFMILGVFYPPKTT